MSKSLLTTLFICLLGYGAWSQEVKKTVVYFEYNQHKLTEKAKTTIQESLQLLEKQTLKNVLIIGHTDTNGDAKYNQILSKKRAETTSNYLLSQGLKKSLLTVQFEGENEPINENINSKEKPVNRRVELVFTFFNKKITKAKAIQLEKNQEAFAIPAAFKVNFQKIEINPTKANTLSLDEKGTNLHIPANSFVDENGKTVNENVLISYREYKNSADMAFSGIPMTYQKTGELLFFNSAGMFEIEGRTLDEKMISIASDKALTIDYALANETENIDFYELKENNWEEKQAIQPRPIPTTEYDTSYTPRLAWDGWSRRKLKDNNIKDQHVEVNVSGGDSMVIVTIKGEKVAEGPWRNGKFEGKILKKKWQNENGQDLMQTILDMNIPIMKITPKRLEKYDNIVEGLTLKNFGVYNCDQIYKVPNLIMIDANYIDENGNQIENTYKLSMIDLNYNGAFGFEPEHFYFGAKSKTVLVLFTRAGELFLLEEKELAAMNLKESGRYTFKMKNMTETIKNTADLATYLGL